MKAIKNGTSLIYGFSMDADITDEHGAICGGNGIVLMDAHPEKSLDVFNSMEKSIREGRSGILATIISGEKEVNIERSWFENGKPDSKQKSMERIQQRTFNVY